MLPASFSLSDSFTAHIVDNEINPSQQALFELTLTNSDEVAHTYTFYSLVQGWDVEPTPIKDKVINLGQREKKTITIKARPTAAYKPGIYSLPVSVRREDNVQHDLLLKVYLSPEKPLDYLPAIKVTLDMPEKINPQENVAIKLFLENRNPLDLKGVVVKIESDIPEFVKETRLDLPPKERRTVEFSITPNKHQQPKDYILFFLFEKDGEVVKAFDKRIEVLTNVPQFTITTNERKTFLKRYVDVTITNDGNILNTQEVMLPVTFWQALVSSSEDFEIEAKENGRFFVTELTLGPNEPKTLVYVINNRIPVYILLILLALFGFYLRVRSHVIVRKRASTSHHDKESVSEVKVTLEVINRSSHPLKNISVTDMVPAIANVEKTLELGTLKPHEIRHTNKGTKAIWVIAELDGHEHRLISYKVRAKLNILGTFELPRAVIEYHDTHKRKRKAYSNIFRVG